MHPGKPGGYGRPVYRESLRPPGWWEQRLSQTRTTPPTKPGCNFPLDATAESLHPPCGGASRLTLYEAIPYVAHYSKITQKLRIVCPICYCSIRSPISPRCRIGTLTAQPTEESLSSSIESCDNI